MAYGILTGEDIHSEIKAGNIEIDPFDETRLNPASVDLRLGRTVAVYTAVVNADFSVPPSSGSRTGRMSSADTPGCIPGCMVTPKTGFHCFLDAAKKNEVAEYEMGDGGFLLRPGVGYLMHTAERVRTDKFVPIIDGKSSIGRLFAFVHVTAGYGDPGFDGQYTLEVVVIHPLVVYPGMRFCQMRFHTKVGEGRSYQDTGSYKGKLAEGPIPSQSYKMFA